MCHGSIRTDHYLFNLTAIRTNGFILIEAETAAEDARSEIVPLVVTDKTPDTIIILNLDATATGDCWVERMNSMTTNITRT